MHSLLARHEEPEPFYDQSFRRKFVLDAPAEEPLNDFSSMVKYESHDTFLVEVS